MSLENQIARNLANRKSRKFSIGTKTIGGDSPILIQSMAATKTSDLEQTIKQIRLLESAGADLIRIAIDSPRDVEALVKIRDNTDANLVVDIQESYRLAEKVAPYVQKLRYNPGHLYHHQKNLRVEDKVKYLVDVCEKFNCALRIGVNCGSLDPNQAAEDPEEQALESALRHVSIVEDLKFFRFVVSIKSSDPFSVIRVNKRFYKLKPEVPLHLGVTEAGLLPEGAIKSRVSFENLLSEGIGDTLRVSLTLPDESKDLEIKIGREIVDDVLKGRFRSVPDFKIQGLNVISCPSCSRVENRAFVKLAEDVKELCKSFEIGSKNLTVAVMGCRVNGPGETDKADLGLWCAPNHVNLKKGTTLLGSFPYESILERLREELENISKK